MKFEFGCGETQTPGYVSVDVRKLPGIDYVCNAWEIGKYCDDEIASFITSRHFLEHLTFHQASETLKAWWTLLEQGGKVEIIVPNMIFHIRQWMDPNRRTLKSPTSEMTIQEWAISGFWGKQRETEKGDLWDVHKSGYDFNLLYDMLTEHGYTNVERVHSAPKNLHVTAMKEIG
jgi:predicted SAM-dependent methyltransferase